MSSDDPTDGLPPARVEDPVDAQIIREVSRDGRATLADISKSVGLSVSAVQARLRRLEARGVIVGYRAVLDPDAVGPLFERVRWIAAAMPAALGCQGTFVAANNVVSQSVAHLHVHVVPRTKGDGLRGFFWPRTRYAAGEAAAVAARLRGALAG